MRNALYDKSLTFSASDFEGFGTGSMITRTLNDVNVVQQAFVWSVQMVLPVPLMCVIGVLMAFSIDHVMGLLLIGITLVVILGAVLVTRRPRPSLRGPSGFWTGSAWWSGRTSPGPG